MEKRKHDSMLDYRVTDVLEMNYSENHKMLEAVKSELLSRSIKDKRLYPLFTFVLEDMLVVIHNGLPRECKQLFLLNSHEKSFRIFDLDCFNLKSKGG